VAITFGGSGGLVDSRATVTRGLKSWHSFFLSLAAMRSAMGLVHWKHALETVYSVYYVGVAAGAMCCCEAICVLLVHSLSLFSLVHADA
jgi:hypothetical protein